MITLYPAPSFTRFKPGRRASSNRKAEDFAPGNAHQVKAEARRVLSAGLSPQTWRILDLLATGGVFSASRLVAVGVSERTLQRLAQAHILERLVQDADSLCQSFETFGLKGKNPCLYMLGPVGVELVTQRHEIAPPVGYQGYTLNRVLHDVITNEIVLRLAEALDARGWTVEWLGKYEGELLDKTGNHSLLEPDALIRFRKHGDERAFLLEYHNEDKQARAALKVQKYETAFNEGNWRQRWEVETFPPVLAVFWQPIVGAGYKSAVEGKRLNCAYYGKTLKVLLDGKLDEWVNIASGQKESLLPQEG